MKKQLVLFCLLLVIPGIMVSQKQLTYSFTKGDSFTISQNTTQEITQTLPIGDQLVINEISGTMNFKVTKIQNDLISVEMRYQQLKMRMSSPNLGDLMKVDTSIKPDSTDTQGLIFQGLIDRPVTFDMKPTGKIVSLTGANDLIDSMLTTAKINDPETAKTVRATLDGQWGDETLINSLEQMIYIYGKNNKNAGDTWKNEYTGDLSAQNNWKIAAILDTNIELNSEATVQMNTKNKDVTMNLSGNQQTKVTVNPQNGLLLNAEVNGTCQGDAVMTVFPDTKIPTKITFTHKYKTLN